MTKTLTAPDIGEHNHEETQSEQALQNTPQASAIMNLSELKSRRKVIREVYEDVMIEGLHYGKPFKDSSKPSLLKAGGEVLANTFMLSPKYQRVLRDLGDGHREIEFCCQLFHIPTSNFVGEGYGSCSTKESKYRYRSGDDATDIPVEAGDWDVKERQGNAEFFSHLKAKYTRLKGSLPKGADIGMTKVDGNWFVSLRGKVENPDIANEYNTVLKIAKKRALNDAVLTATGASEYFTQDVEDILANESAAAKGATTSTPDDATTPTPDTAKPKGRSAAPAGAITPEQRRLIRENMINLPKQRQDELMSIINRKKPISKRAAQRIVEFLISYDQAFSGVVELVDVMKHNIVPDVMWNALESARSISDLQPITDAVAQLLRAEKDGDSIDVEIAEQMNRHLDNIIARQNG